ncbi:glutathione S-transferase family protein [Roseibium sp. RKSG952]|uniref:glutathione S-transferase family protein n=1 Tax=Roseibium sp. RKSG952 TaxID=2529384 RepID=UPI0012BBEB1E|nr:glutathione S-transferase [Roseibium sp. RKSG952]MTI00236.1 glutathione S-transferase [Roseibium sp. RKSG952]
MAEYTLHCFAQSGYSYKVALMLELSGASWEPVYTDYFKGQTRTVDFRETMNEMGEVPVLKHGPTRLTQSGVILDYLTETLGTFGWNDNTERREILRWILFDNHKLSGYLGPLRFLRCFTGNGETDVTKWLEGRAVNAHEVLDKHLQGKPFVVGNRPTIADLSLCGYLFWPDEIGIDFTPYPNINRWLSGLQDLPGWKAPYDLMPGHPLPVSA